MGSEPNKNWAVNSPIPPADDVAPIVTIPFVLTDNKLFIGKTQISLECDTDGSELYLHDKLFIFLFLVNTPTLGSVSYLPCALAF